VKPPADPALSQQAEQLGRGEAALARSDYTAAYDSFRSLAMRGNTRAQTRLAEMYATGQGVKRNPNQAYIWYSLAAQGGSAGAAAERAKIAALLQPAEIAQADRVVDNMRKR
jgi:localization factor PodJL